MRSILLVLLMSIGVGSVQAADLPRSSPEAQGVSSKAVLSFIEAADRNIDGMHSFMKGTTWIVDTSQQELFDEMTSFPFGSQDDSLDASATGAEYLQGQGQPRMWR